MIKHDFFFLNSHGLLCVSYSFLLFGRKCLGTPLQNFYKPRWFQQKNISFLVLVLTIFSKPLLIKRKLWNGLFAVQKHVSVDFSSNVTEHLFPLHSNSNDISKGRKKKKRKIFSKQGCGFSKLWKWRAPERPQEWSWEALFMLWK